MLRGRDRVADNGRRKPALRAEAESLAFHITAGLRNTLSQYIEAFQRPVLRRDESQHDKFVFGNVLQRSKRPRASIVILQQQTLCFDRPKELAADRFIITL